MNALVTMIAAATALWLSLRNGRRLGVAIRELPRYGAKATNLGLCYAAFARRSPLLKNAVGAGRAAFLSCAYDVATDWRDFDPRAREAFFAMTGQLCNQSATAIAHDLYVKDQGGCLSDDGLERGSYAVRFIQEMIERPVDLQPSPDRIGVLLQIVDDVLDLDGDVRRDEQNCLRGEDRDRHLTDLRDHQEVLMHAFSGRRVMTAVVRRACSKVEVSLARSG